MIRSILEPGARSGLYYNQEIDEENIRTRNRSEIKSRRRIGVCEKQGVEGISNKHKVRIGSETGAKL